MRRPLALSQLVIGISAGLLMVIVRGSIELLNDKCLCRPLALSQLVIGISAGLLMVTSRADTALLFVGRASSMGSYAILYVYTPEVRPACNLGSPASSAALDTRDGLSPPSRQ